MRRALLTLVIALFAASAAQAQTGVPTGKGLPVRVNVAVEFVELIGFKENTGVLTATVDVRLRWQDLRLRRSAQDASQSPQIFRGAEAGAQIAKMWVPPVEFANQRGKAAYTSAGLWIYPDGSVEMIKRTSGDFASSVSVDSFPFDRQKLRLDIAVRDVDAQTVVLVFDENDFNDSRRSKQASLDGWELGNVTLRGEAMNGWHGATHSQVVASLEIIREPAMIIASIFIPLFASLLIPMLSIWLNRSKDGNFRIETFELVNIIIGGLFAVIALNFTINSTYEMLGSGANPVHELLALNYLTLGIGLVVNVLLFRYGVVARLFGRYVQEQVYFFVCWALPVLTLATAAMVIGIALA